MVADNTDTQPLNGPNGPNGLKKTIKILGWIGDTKPISYSAQ